MQLPLTAMPNGDDAPVLCDYGRNLSVLVLAFGAYAFQHGQEILIEGVNHFGLLSTVDLAKAENSVIEPVSFQSGKSASFSRPIARKVSLIAKPNSRSVMNPANAPIKKTSGPMTVKVNNTAPKA